MCNAFGETYVFALVIEVVMYDNEQVKRNYEAQIFYTNLHSHITNLQNPSESEIASF